jgi:hypothetical protein
VFILKEDKVVCFVSALQVLILNNLLGRNCTGIVQIAWCFVSVADKHFSQRGDIRKQKRQQDAGGTKKTHSVT